MKAAYILSIVALSILSACKSDQKMVDEIANDMCQALSNYSEEDSNTLLEAATNLEQMNLKYHNYGTICTSQLKSTMEKKCPEGYKKLVQLEE